MKILYILSIVLLTSTSIHGMTPLQFITWKLSSGKNEKIELNYEFDVIYPKGERVGGL